MNSIVKRVLAKQYGKLARKGDRPTARSARNQEGKSLGEVNGGVSIDEPTVIDWTQIFAGPTPKMIFAFPAMIEQINLSMRNVVAIPREWMVDYGRIDPIVQEEARRVVQAGYEG